MGSVYTNDSVPFYIAHHESKRAYEITEEMLHHAQDENYDMLTAPITNDAFHSRVLGLISNHLAASTDRETSNVEDNTSSTPAPIIPPLTLMDTSLAPNESVSQLIYLTSSWTDLCSSDPLIADISRQVLLLEIAYASFCGASNVMIQGPSSRPQGYEGDGLVQYARAIQDALSAGIYIHVQILLPMSCSSKSQSLGEVGNLADFARPEFTEHLEKAHDMDEDALASWDAWNLIRSNCKYNARLSVALTLPKEVPQLSIQRRWFSEPLKILEIPSSSFHKSPKGLVTLSQPQRQLLSLYMRLRYPPWLILSDVGPLPGLEEHGNDPSFQLDDEDDEMWQTSPTPAEASRQPQHPSHQPPKRSPHLHHLRDLQTRQPPKPAIERFGTGYQDYLQSPLQPLTDNLESITYEVFEKDPVKYDWYERAITAALLDWTAHKKPASGPNGAIVVAVVGAGRGPLVTRALRASAAAGVKIEMWAVEKNPNAFVLLQRHNATEWNNLVHLVHSDMRSWPGPLYPIPSSNTLTPTTPTQNPTKIDILISELLGSFADNELSPECLDGAQHLLNPTHGLSIPQSYTAHATPISAPKLFADIAARSAAGVPDAAQIPYVVMLHAVDYLSTQTGNGVGAGMSASAPAAAAPAPLVKQVWEFKHPLPARHLARPEGGSATATGNEHNRRHCRLEFPCPQQGVCHGIAGYFETVLYSPSPANTTAQTSPSPSSPATNISLSTNPLTQDTLSKDMISWFPIFFPLKTPLYVPAGGGAVLVVNLWRRTDGRCVWYEWLVECFLEVEGQGAVGGKARKGAGAKRIRVGMSELHSSVGNACQM